MIIFVFITLAITFSVLTWKFRNDTDTLITAILCWLAVAIPLGVSFADAIFK